MTDKNENLEQRVARLETQVAELTAALSVVRDKAPQEAIAFFEQTSERSVPSADGASEELLSWVDRAYILPRLATTSFVLVVALALRVLTDGGVIELQLGTLLGMVYGFFLIAYSWFAYSNRSAQAPVFALWGTIVMCSVVVETHRVFQALPTMVAYLLLVTTGWVTVLMSRRYRVALPVFVGTIGMSFGSFAIDYPDPVFPLLTVIMILANAFAAYATRFLRASWLRWLLFILSLFMVQIWGLKLGLSLDKTSAALAFSLQGFLPAAWSLALAFALISLAGVLGKIQEKVSKFDIVLPVLNVSWVFGSMHYVIGYKLVEPWVFGVPAVFVGAAHLWLAWWLVRRGGETAHGTTSFALAGGLLIALALPSAVGHALIASTLIAALAVGLSLASMYFGHGGVRLISYLLQFYASASLVVLLHATETTEPSLVGAAASGLLAAIGAYHYYWSRRNPPPAGGPLTDRFNRGDCWAALLLVATLLSGFFTLRMGLYQTLQTFQLATPAAFGSGQSLLVNLAAIALLVIGLRQHNKELRNVGILVTVVAVCKVFLDLFSFKGFPLLISIFSFGIVAATASFVLGRWGKAVAEEKATAGTD